MKKGQIEGQKWTNWLGVPVTTLTKMWNQIKIKKIQGPVSSQHCFVIQRLVLEMLTHLKRRLAHTESSCKLKYLYKYMFVNTVVSQGLLPINKKSNKTRETQKKLHNVFLKHETHVYFFQQGPDHVRIPGFPSCINWYNSMWEIVNMSQLK